MDIPLFKIYWDEDDVKAVSDSVRRGMNWAAGPNIEKFETLLAEYLGVKFVAAFNSGTSALHSALLAYGIKKDDEVIVPSFTFIATANAVLMVGAKPVFADIEEETYGLDPEDVRKKITSKTKAIIPVHYGGYACKIQKLKELAKEHNLLLIEDTAESFGAKENGKLAGTFGDSAMFSLCQTKVFTTGEGGFMVTDSKDIYEKLKLLRSHGRLETADYFTSGEFMDYVALGYNFRMPDIIAALGISQLKKVDKLIELRREHAKYLTENLSGIDEIIIPKVPENIFHVYQEYPIKIKAGKEARDALKKYLAERGIGTRISFPPIHFTHFYKNVLGYNDKLEVTEKISSQALTLPLYPSLTKGEMDYMAKEIKNFYSPKS
ncbi:MAG: DegT/DnrJ/EryC1/StrS family aminotransferase [bacterium]|nr:DegT/DnrJ/EryC1/StrS family aminotransferase [bacterium]